MNQWSAFFFNDPVLLTVRRSMKVHGTQSIRIWSDIAYLCVYASWRTHWNHVLTMLRSTIFDYEALGWGDATRPVGRQEFLWTEIAWTCSQCNTSCRSWSFTSTGVKYSNLFKRSCKEHAQPPRPQKGQDKDEVCKKNGSASCWFSVAINQGLNLVHFGAQPSQLREQLKSVSVTQTIRFESQPHSLNLSIFSSRDVLHVCLSKLFLEQPPQGWRHERVTANYRQGFRDQESCP